MKDMETELKNQRYEELVFYLNGRVLAELRTMRKTYMSKVDYHNRANYQTAKLMEEVGEFTQAFYERNSCQGLLKYPDIRGTIESEAADVILSGCLLSLLLGCGILSVPQKGVLLDDPDYFVTTLFDDAANQGVNKIIRNIHELIGSSCDLKSHVRARLQFNKDRLVQEGKVVAGKVL